MIQFKYGNNVDLDDEDEFNYTISYILNIIKTHNLIKIYLSN